MTQSHRDLVVIGASAGGLVAIRAVLQGLPTLLDATILIINHLSGSGESQLAEILARATGLPVRWAEDGMPLTPGAILVAPGGRHLIVREERVQLVGGARENHSRPSISRALRSVAACRGGRSVGVLLSGALDDGVSGLVTLRRCGGLIAVQNPDDALVSDMPRNALAALSPDAVFRAEDGGEVVGALLGRPVTDVQVSKQVLAEAALDLASEARPDDRAHIGAHSAATCPECGGPTWIVGSDEEPAVRCLVGHRIALPLALRGKEDEIERAMWGVVRRLEERLALRRRVDLVGEEGAPAAREEDTSLLARARALALALVDAHR